MSDDRGPVRKIPLPVFRRMLRLISAAELRRHRRREEPLDHHPAVVVWLEVSGLVVAGEVGELADVFDGEGPLVRPGGALDRSCHRCRPVRSTRSIKNVEGAW